MSVLGCLGLVVIGMQPPNDKAIYVVVGSIAALAAGWWLFARHHFPGPPPAVLTLNEDARNDG